METKHVELKQFLHAFASRGFDSVSWAFLLLQSLLFCTCETHFIHDEKCAHFNALYYANALYVFLDFSLFIPITP